MKPTALISTIEQMMLVADAPACEATGIVQRAIGLEAEITTIVLSVDLALTGLDAMDPARLDLEEIRRAAERAIMKLSTITGARPRPVLHAI